MFHNISPNLCFKVTKMPTNIQKLRWTFFNFFLTNNQQFTSITQQTDGQEKKVTIKKKTKKTPKRQPKPSDEKLLSFNVGKKYNLVENNHKAEADIQQHIAQAQPMRLFQHKQPFYSICI